VDSFKLILCVHDLTTLKLHNLEKHTGGDLRES